MVKAADLMAIVMARLLRDGETVFHGVASPLPMVAILLARRLHAPHLTYLNITGAVGARPTHLPRSTVDAALARGAPAQVTLTDLFDLAARGRLDTVFLSGVQIDRAGRINLSMVPGVRLPGGAGSAALMPTARRTILWRTRHDRRTFVDALPFVTAAGHVDRVVTPLCVFRRISEQLAVESLHSGVTPANLSAATGFSIAVDDSTPRTPAPTGAELATLAQIDPDRIRDTEF